MPGSSKKRVKRQVTTKKNGYYGETSWDGKGKTIIKINKRRHTKKKKHAKWVKKNKNGSANLLDTIVHEELHARHHKMKEKTVRKKARTVAKKMSKKQRHRLYARYAK